MGNGTSRVVGCFVPSNDKNGGNVDLEFLEPLDEGLGHSFCYVRPSVFESPVITPSNSERFTLDSSTIDSETLSGSFRQEGVDDASCLNRHNSKSLSETTFRTISGASVSANVSTARSGNQSALCSSEVQEPAASFESTSSFSAIPLQPVPRGSGPLNGFMSGPLERGFASGPLGRNSGFMSGPIERGVMSGPIDISDRSNFSAPLSLRRRKPRLQRFMRSFSKPVRSTFARTFSRRSGGFGWIQRFFLHSGTRVSWHAGNEGKLDSGPQENCSENSCNLQWAHGKAGEDRVHVVLSEEQGWLFIGIYDGFSGPDAPDFVMSHLYRAIDKELEGLLWDYEEHKLSEASDREVINEEKTENPGKKSMKLYELLELEHFREDLRNGTGDLSDESGSGNRKSHKSGKIRRMYEKQKSLRKKMFPWNYDWHREENREERRSEPAGSIRRCWSGTVDHEAVLRAMAKGLERTEEAYMETVEKCLDTNAELALMGSCVLVMLMKDQDVYVMNVGDSRAILAQERLNDGNPNSMFGKKDNDDDDGDDDVVRYRNRSRESLVRMELDRISEESPIRNQADPIKMVNKNSDVSSHRLKMRAVQLTSDHSTNIEEEVIRIRTEHPDDEQAIMKDRVKGQLKVTRAFGAGFLKKPNFNEALLEVFRVEYVGSGPYINCRPCTVHHRLTSSDRFMVLSSDGLYEYFSNEEVVAHVTWFMEHAPDGDPAQYLIAELLSRAATKNGMEFHDLLDIPQGDRRKYHDDVSVMVVSLEGRIWRSSGQYLPQKQHKLNR